MNKEERDAVYMRSEWVDSPTGAPLETVLTEGELLDILCVAQLKLRHKESEKNHPHLRSGLEKLQYFSERHEFGDD